MEKREVRVFVSSTFRDLAEERDELARHAFPELRRFCAGRGLPWTDVDLRWGITDEQGAEGEVLELCLGEISKCRPFFIGILGNRYGWVPDSISPDLLSREPWLADSLGRSVTELEICHGVLNHPHLAADALFYFRTSADEPDSRVQALKTRVQQSGSQVRPFREPRELAGLVVADIKAAITRRFSEQPVDENTAATLRHARFGECHRRVPMRQRSLFDELEATAMGTADRPLVVVGPPGSGKTGLTAGWWQDFQARHPEVAGMVHHIGADVDSTDWATTARRILGVCRTIAVTHSSRLPMRVRGAVDSPKAGPQHRMRELAGALALARSSARGRNPWSWIC